MGLYSFTLPHTPPPAAGEEVSIRKILGLDALAQLKSRPFIVFIISSFLICIPLAAYYAYAPVFVNVAKISNPAFKMSFGQMSETLFIILMPLFFSFMGIKWMLLTGMFAWVLRYVLFSLAAPFFFVAGQIYVDKKSTPAIRGQAQGFLVLVTYGVGMLIGAQVSGWVFNGIVTGNVENALSQWQVFWIIPALFAGIVMVIFGILFNDRLPETKTAS